MGHASDRFRSSALPPNQYNEDSLPPAAILVFFIFMAQPRACRPKCSKTSVQPWWNNGKSQKRPFNPTESVAATM